MIADISLQQTEIRPRRIAFRGAVTRPTAGRTAVRGIFLPCAICGVDLNTNAQPWHGDMSAALPDPGIALFGHPFTSFNLHAAFF